MLQIQNKSNSLKSLVDSIIVGGPGVTDAQIDVDGQISSSAYEAEYFVRRKMARYIIDYLPPAVLDGVGTGSNFYRITTLLSQILSYLGSGVMYDAQHPVVNDSYINNINELSHFFQECTSLLQQMSGFIGKSPSYWDTMKKQAVHLQRGLDVVHSIFYDMRWGGFLQIAWDTLEELRNYTDSGGVLPTTTTMYVLNKILTSSDPVVLLDNLIKRTIDAKKVMNDWMVYVNANHEFDIGPPAYSNLSVLFATLPVCLTNLSFVYKFFSDILLSMKNNFTDEVGIYASIAKGGYSMNGGNDPDVLAAFDDMIISNDVVYGLHHILNTAIGDPPTGKISLLVGELAKAPTNQVVTFLRESLSAFSAFLLSIKDLCYCNPSDSALSSFRTTCSSACSGDFGSMFSSGGANIMGEFMHTMTTLDNIIIQGDFALEHVGGFIDSFDVDAVHIIALTLDFLVDFEFIDSPANYSDFTISHAFGNRFGAYNSEARNFLMSSFSLFTNFFMEVLVCSDCPTCGENVICEGMNFTLGHLTVPEHFFHTKLHVDYIRYMNKTIDQYFVNDFFPDPAPGFPPTLTDATIGVVALYNDYYKLYSAIILLNRFSIFFDKLVELEGLSGLTILLYRSLTMLMAVVGIVMTIERKGDVNPVNQLSEDVKALNNDLYWADKAYYEAKANPANINPDTGEYDDMLIQQDAWQRGTAYLHINERIDQIVEKLEAISFE